MATLPQYRPIPNNFLNIGAEFGTAHFGQLNINFYGVPHSNPGNFKGMFVLDEHEEFMLIKFLDKGGVSTQFSYRFKRFQGTLFISRSDIWTLQKNERYYPETVWNVGVGVQYYLSANFSIRVKYILFDKYQQGRLNRPPEIYKIRYSDRSISI